MRSGVSHRDFLSLTCVTLPFGLHTDEITDIDGFLPPTTLDWIKTQLLRHGINQPDANRFALLDDGSRLHVHAYIQLRNITRRHHNAHALRILTESAKPRGGYDWIERRDGYLAGLIRENERIKQQYEEDDEREEAELAELEV